MSTISTQLRPHHVSPRSDRYHRRVRELQIGSDPDTLGWAFARGEADLRAVYDRHAPLVYSICRKALGEPAAAEVTQDVFVNAWKARHQFDPERGALGAWLVGIAKRRIVDHVRREARHTTRRAEHDAERVEAISADDHPEEVVDRISERMRVAHALAALQERPRQVIGLAYVHGLTHQEIAERTGIPLGTIKSDIRRGLLALRDVMEQGDE
jgi:RNA polymerase sigma-70 factor (ECF subfamily)